MGKTAIFYTIVAFSFFECVVALQLTPLQEKVHDKITYIAAVVDRTHARLQDDLSAKYADRGSSISKENAFKVMHNHIQYIGKIIRPDIKELIRMSDNVPQSVLLVNQHFAEDHIEPVLTKGMNPDLGEKPEWFKPTVKEIAKFAQEHIESIFKNIQQQNTVD